MKKVLIVWFTLGIVFAFSAISYADWELYDDFSSGTIDPLKWNIDDSSAIISVVGGRAKFVHQIDHPNDSGYLLFNYNANTIFGIKATVTVESCTGDVRARFAGYAGKIGENYIWSGLQLQESKKRIYSNASLEGPPPGYEFIKSFFYANFQKPIDVQGNSYIATMMFENDKITYEVDGLGKMTYRYSTPVVPTDSFFRAIGTRSSNGDGPCTVYFDDVYVFRP